MVFELLRVHEGQIEEAAEGGVHARVVAATNADLEKLVEPRPLPLRQLAQAVGHGRRHRRG